MNLTEAAIKYKSVVAVITGLIVLFGYISISQLPLQLLPNVQRPQITMLGNLAVGDKVAIRGVERLEDGQSVDPIT